MAKIDQFLFFSEDSTEQVSNSFIVPNAGCAITLQVEDIAGSGVSLSVEGMNDLKEKDLYQPIKVIGLGDFKTYNKITTAGLYMIICEGLFRVRMKSDNAVGGFKAYGVAVG